MTRRSQLRKRLSTHIRRITQPSFLKELPMRPVDFFIMSFIKYASYVLYYPYWVWRNKSVRNGIFWFAIISALVAEFFGIAALLTLLGMAGQFAIAAGYMVFQFAVMFIFLSRTKNVEIFPGDTGVVTFAKHFYGQSHIKEAVLGTLDMMSQKNQAAMKALGADPPSGAILTGPPGTGKTLIAQCTAGEIQIPYIGLNGSDLSAMFVGVGEMKVKSLYAKARKLANQYGGCVIFIDEIDAATSSRGNVEGAEGEQVQRGGGGGMFGGGGMGIRSQLLTAMDGTKEPHIRTDLINFFFRFFGFEELRDGVVFWLGATNMLTSVDPAFLRPGRIGDMIIQVDPPDKGSRRQIIQGYVNQITIDDTVDVERLTNDTQGFTPADISAAVKRVSARSALREGRTAISQADIESALMEQMFGIANPIAEFDEGQREQVATHEAGHALETHLILLDKRRITNLSIIRRGRGMLGFMRKVSPEEIYAMPLAEVCAQIQISWAGDIACEILMGERWTGGTGDFDAVDQMMTTLARHGYFDDRLPLDPLHPFADEKIARAAEHYADRVKAVVRAHVTDYREHIETLRDELLDKGELNSAEIYDILEGITL